MIKDKILKIVNRDKDRFYDYLTLKLKNIDEIKVIDEFIKEQNIDLYFYINTSYGINIYVQYSSESKDIVKDKLKSIHTFWRVKFNNDLGYKKSSKHSLFFGGKNLIIKNINNIKLDNQKSKSFDNFKLDSFNALLPFDEKYYKFNIDPSFMGLTENNRIE